MLSFFRRVRKALITQSKVRTYLLYAVGEIALVMIGILLALQVNNWNESLKQDVAEQEFIKGVKHDLSQDRDYIQMIIQSAESKFRLLDILEKEIFFLYENDRQQLDSLVNAYFIAERTFYPISGSFESAVSGNEISKFKNKTFTSAVTKIYNSGYARLRDNALETDRRWFSNSKKYSRIRRTERFPEMNSEQIKIFLDDLYSYNMMLEYYINVLRDTIEMIDEVIDKS
jgi:hypothetical protein